jgi:NAD(P)-dependent dehydrogenase (short-subunit alcohol dehydrogenase family)
VAVRGGPRRRNGIDTPPPTDSVPELALWTGLGRIVRLLVTGGASGLGRAIALGAAQRGAVVAVADIDKAGCEAVAKACGGHALVVDLTNNAEQAVEDAAKLLGGLDVLVNNAGFGAGEAFLEMRAETWDRTLGLNVKALALATAAAGRIMMKKKAGRIINITSPASRMALPNYTAYAASKAAVDAITRAAAVALAPHGIRVNSVAPGMMDTPMQRVTEEQLARIEGRNDLDKFLAERTARIPIGKRIEPEEVAKTVLWLAFDAPDYITAERLNVSGGLDKD